MTQDNKLYSFGKTQQEAEDNFVKNLLEGQSWCAKSAIHWAEIKTYHLPKELILFNLGVLAFVGAMKGSYANNCILYVILFLAAFSMISSFWFIWGVINENIKNINNRGKILGGALEGVFEGQEMKGIIRKYSEDMTHSRNDMSSQEIKWNKWQKASILAFILAVIMAVGGLFI